MSNTVSITGVGAADECVVIALAQEGQEEKRTLWLGRYIAALRGMVLIFSTPEEANLAQEALHGKVLDSGCIVAASIGRKLVAFEEIAAWELAAPKRVIQLISPPSSPPEWWAGWNDVEGDPNSPPELLVNVEQEETLRNSNSRVRELNILKTNMYAAVENLTMEESGANDRPPRVTIEAPPESITGLPEGFILVEDKANQQSN